VFLREIGAELFNFAFEAELVAAYQPRGVAPLPPALPAMVTLLQGLRSRWRCRSGRHGPSSTSAGSWSLGCLGASAAPFLPTSSGEILSPKTRYKCLARTPSMFAASPSWRTSNGLPGSKAA